MNNQDKISNIDLFEREKHEYALRTLPEHRRLAGRWDDLYRLLTNFDFLEDKCRVLSIYDLETDYEIALACWQGESVHREILAKFEERLRLESHILHATPELFFTQIYNHLTWVDAPNGTIHSLCEFAGKKRSNWLRCTQDRSPRPVPWLRSFEGLTGGVCSAAFSPNGKYILSGSSDASLKLWDTDSGQFLRSFEGHTDRVNAVAFSPNGKQILSGSADASLKLWDTDSGQLLRSFEGHTEIVNAVAFSPDGRQILSGSDDASLKLWDTDSGQILYSYKNEEYLRITSVAFSPDGQIVVAGSGDRNPKSNLTITIELWDRHTGQHLHSLLGHTGTIFAIVFPDDENRIFSVSEDKTIKSWDKNTGQLIHSLKWHASDSVKTAVFSPDGKFIISGSWDNAIHLYSSNTGRLIHSMEGHTDSIYAVNFSTDMQLILSGSWDGTVKI